MTDAELVFADGKAYPAEVILAEAGEDTQSFLDAPAEDTAGKDVPDPAVIRFVCRSFPEGEKPVQVRYAYRSTLTGALIRNAAGLPMTPFVLDIL